MSKFVGRHIGPNDSQVDSMLEVLGFSNLNDFTNQVIPKSVVKDEFIEWEGLEEHEALNELKSIANKNVISKNYYGLGYYGTLTPAVIQRCILENPSWYTQYTPYQPEISQGRLESLLNFQTMVCELTATDISNASLLDEASAASEAMAVAFASRKNKSAVGFWMEEGSFPQTVAVVRSRAKSLGVEICFGKAENLTQDENLFGVFVQQVKSQGDLVDLKKIRTNLHEKTQFIVASDPMALCLFQAPGGDGIDADLVVGSFQRFGVPMGFGGPHAGYIGAKSKYARKLPGRIVGVSKDRHGHNAYRLALQTREQHIRREKATSNICTAQALLANMAVMYGMYHGPAGLKEIAESIRHKTLNVLAMFSKAGWKTPDAKNIFDTFTVSIQDQKKWDLFCAEVENNSVSLQLDSERMHVTMSMDETHGREDVAFFSKALGQPLNDNEATGVSSSLIREIPVLNSPVFSKYQSESKIMRYMHALSSKDLSLVHGMIPLGSCTMKLNAASELMPVSWPEFSSLHPFVDAACSKGYSQLVEELDQMLCEVTGFSAFSFQPNSGAQGEYAALLAIRRFHEDAGESERNICVIPTSAHGTNPASAVMAGMKVALVKCSESGDVDINSMKDVLEKHKGHVAAMMITYPSTHGVFEEDAGVLCDLVHDAGGLVYLDGANMNAQVGLCVPAEVGFDACHLNLHKTFCIPHGGGGPGVGPIGVVDKLVDYLPSHPIGMKENSSAGPVAAAPLGSASLLVIPWMYLKMMGGSGLRKASQIAILNANYIAKKIEHAFPILYKGANDLVAHECIIDIRELTKETGVQVSDVAKRLMDYGFHAPTMAWPVAGTLMIEPTESEDQKELDRFVNALLGVSGEIQKIKSGEWNKENNPLKNAPHTAEDLVASSWEFPYSREEAVFPLGSKVQASRKFWPSVSRVDEAYGDRNFMCTCPDLSEYE